MGSMKHAAWVRPLVALVIGLIAGGLALTFVEPVIAAPTAWVVFVGIYLGWTWRVLSPMSPGDTRTHATMEDPSRTVATTALLVASVASLGGVALLLGAGSRQRNSVLEALLGVLTVAASWLLVHLLSTLHYARLYYSSDTPGRPVDYNSDPQDPDYHDFAYLAFTTGMTYQVSDTSLNTKEIRLAVLRHALLSYLLGAVVLACTVNLVSQVAAGGK